LNFEEKLKSEIEKLNASYVKFIELFKPKFTFLTPLDDIDEHKQQKKISEEDILQNLSCLNLVRKHIEHLIPAKLVNPIIS
jgi:hypothetical protein